MPIYPGTQVRRITDDEFRRIDFGVMGAAFDVQNKYGRLCNENLYQKKIFESLNGVLSVETEVPIVIEHRDYSKQLRVDLIAANGLICEFKAVQKLHPEHESQLLEYMLLCGATHGKLINFGAQSVEGKLITTRLTHEIRRDICLDTTRWLDYDERSEMFRHRLTELAQDWGAFLRPQTWYDATLHFLGGTERVLQNIQFDPDSQSPTHQLAHLISPNTAFKITALRSAKDQTNYEQSLQKFLLNSNLNRIQWVNFNQQTIQFKTLSP